MLTPDQLKEFEYLERLDKLILIAERHHNFWDSSLIEAMEREILPENEELYLLNYWRAIFKTIGLNPNDVRDVYRFKSLLDGQGGIRGVEFEVKAIALRKTLRVIKALARERFVSSSEPTSEFRSYDYDVIEEYLEEFSLDKPRPPGEKDIEPHQPAPKRAQSRPKKT